MGGRDEQAALPITDKLHLENQIKRRKKEKKKKKMCEREKKNNQQLWTGKIVQWVETLAAKPDNPSSPLGPRGSRELMLN